MKVFTINSYGGFPELYKRMGWSSVRTMEEAEVVVFTGGGDIQASIYGDKQHRATSPHVARDKQEIPLFHKARSLDLPMIGICRGAQLLNALSGGRLYQHVSKHHSSHSITDHITGEVVYVTSIHHQMMMPSPEAVIIASSHIGEGREWYDGEVFKKDVAKETPEVVYYESTKCLCFQGHPEFGLGGNYEEMLKYFESLVGRYILENICV